MLEERAAPEPTPHVPDSDDEPEPDIGFSKGPPPPAAQPGEDSPWGFDPRAAQAADEMVVAHRGHSYDPETGATPVTPAPALIPANTDDVDDEDEHSHEETDGLMAAARREPPEPMAVAAATAPAPSRQVLMHVLLWRSPLLTGSLFCFLNVFCLLIIFYHFTVLGLLANMVLCAILAHIVYRLAALAYMRFTNKRLDAFARLKEHASPYTQVIDLAQVEETMAEVASKPIRVDFITPMAAAMEGALNVCLCDIKDAIMLKSFATCCKVTACAWFVAFFCASFDAAQVVYAFVLALFTLPKLWSMRTAGMDDAARAATLRCKQLWAMLHEHVFSKLPSASVLKEM